MLYILGKRLYNAQAGLIAAFLFAVYPPAIHFAVQKIWSTNLFALAVLSVVSILLRLADYPKVRSGIYLGLLLAFTALVDPVIIGVYPFAFVWLYLKAAGSRRTVIKMIAAAMLALFLGLSPWLVRNYLVFGQFVFIKSNFGNELYLGNREGTTGSDKDYKDADWEMSHLPAAEQEYLRLSDEVARNSFLLHKAVTFIVEDPLSFVQRTMHRFMRYWTSIKSARSREDKIVHAAYLTVLTLAVIGLGLSNMRRYDVQLVLLFLLLLPVPYYLAHISFFRYRFPTDSILIIFAGYSIHWIACHLRRYGYCHYESKSHQAHV